MHREVSLRRHGIGIETRRFSPLAAPDLHRITACCDASGMAKRPVNALITLRIVNGPLVFTRFLRGFIAIP